MTLRWAVALSITWFVFWLACLALSTAATVRLAAFNLRLATFFCCLMLGTSLGLWMKPPPKLIQVPTPNFVMFSSPGQPAVTYACVDAATLPDAGPSMRGAALYCMDCQSTDACTSGGAGAISTWDGKVWRCK